MRTSDLLIAVDYATAQFPYAEQAGIPEDTYSAKIVGLAEHEDWAGPYVDIYYDAENETGRYMFRVRHDLDSEEYEALLQNLSDAGYAGKPLEAAVGYYEVVTLAYDSLGQGRISNRCAL